MKLSERTGLTKPIEPERLSRHAEQQQEGMLPTNRTLRKRMMALSTGLALALVWSCAPPEPAAPSSAGPVRVDALIRGGMVYDGSTAPPVVADIAIRDDRIVYVGPRRDLVANRTIDATGMIVAPGFIDPHTHAEIFLRSEQRSERVNAAWLLQGVSTVMIGVDGGGSPDVAETANALTRAAIGTNAVPMVGFGAVRSRVMGQAARAPDAGELAAMKALVAGAMCEGAAGFSTGLFYVPQSFSRTEEVIALAREAAIRGGIYDTHQRDESSYSIGLMGSLREAIRIGEEAGMPVHIAHIKALGVDVQGRADEVIALVAAARARGVRVTADQYPWLASGSSLDASLLPAWSLDGGRAALLTRLQEPAQKARIVAEMQENLRRRGGAEALLLTAADQPWSGRTLAQEAARRGADPVETALAIIAAVFQKGGRGTEVASFNMAQGDVEAFMRQPWVLTASDGSLGHPRMFATYPEKYRTYVRDRRTIDLGAFIRSATGLVADTHGIAGRGYLREGYFADVLVIDPENYRPRATYLSPRELSAGVAALFVNGTLAVEAGAVTGAMAGRVLLRKPSANCPAS